MLKNILQGSLRYGQLHPRCAIVLHNFSTASKKDDEEYDPDQGVRVGKDGSIRKTTLRMRRKDSPLHRNIFPTLEAKPPQIPQNIPPNVKSSELTLGLVERGHGEPRIQRTKLNNNVDSLYIDSNDVMFRSTSTKSKETEELSNSVIGIDEIDDPHDRRSELFPTEGLRVLASSQESERAKQDRLTGYRVFRAMAPYIAVHRDSVMVIHIPGEVLESELVDDILHDIILLKTLGVKPVLVAGCRPQVRKRLLAFGIRSFFVKGNRVCDEETLKHCQSVAGHVRVEIESKLGRGLLNSPIGTGVGSVSVVSGNLVRAIPYGVRGGIDYKYTGVIQKVEAKRILSLLDQGDIVLLGHLGYSQSAHVFHCRSEEVAVKAAIDLSAEKLVFFHNGESVVDVNRGGAVVHNLSLNVASKFAEMLIKEVGEADGRLRHSDADPMKEWKRQFLDYLWGAIDAVSKGVDRVHLVSRHIEGSIISELCTRDGMGIMISYDLYDGVRKAVAKDIPAMLNLMKPLEARGILVTRPPEQIHMEIDRFFVFERDGDVLACFQLMIYEDKRYGTGAAEMSCVAVSPALQREGIGNALLSYCLRQLLTHGIDWIFVLTTRSSHWFIDRGFEERPSHALPPKKLAVYDHRRNPKVYFKKIEDEKSIDAEEIVWSQRAKDKDI